METRERSSRRAKWERICAEYETSGKSLKVFSEELGLRYHKLQYWRKVFREQRIAADRPEVSAVFRELRNTSVTSTYHIGLKNGRTLSLEDGFTESALRRLLGVLESC